MNIIASIRKSKPKEILFNYGFYFIFLALLVAYGSASNLFLTLSNIRLMLNSTVYILLLASGVTLVLITGNIDLSVGSVALLSAAITALTVRAGWPVYLSMFLGVLVGGVAGLLNGILVAYLRMNSMLATLGLLIAYRGLALQITRGAAIMLPQVFKKIGRAQISGISLILIISLVLVAVLQFVLRRTRFGMHCYALGCNEDAAKNVGVPTKRIKVIAFVIAGICASITGFFMLSVFGLYQDSIGRGVEFTIVAAIVIGGTSLLGGRGNILPGTFFGVLLLYVIDNGLALLSASPFVYPFVQGLVIFLAMYMDSLRTYRQP